MSGKVESIPSLYWWL